MTANKYVVHRISRGFLFLLLIALCVPFTAAYGQQLPEPLFNARVSGAEQTATEHLSIRAAGIHELRETTGHVTLDDFPVAPGKRAAVELHRIRPAIDARTRIIAGTSTGDIAMTTPDIACFRGVIPGEANSSIFITTASDMIFCTIRRGDGSHYVLAPASSGRNEHILMNEQQVKPSEQAPNFSCVSSENMIPRTSSIAAPGPYRAPSTLLNAEIAVEADYPYFRATHKDTNQTIAYTAALFSMVSVIYEDEINVTLHVPWLKIWTDSIADPYKVNGNAYALWDTVPRYWQKYYSDVPRHLAHVLTSVSYGGGGIATLGGKNEGNIGAICSNDYGYGMSSPTGAVELPTFAFSYDVYIVAHEMGHNFGARHTHTCWWSPAIDTCVTRDDQRFKLDDACHALPITPRMSSGSIMSYCQNTNYGISGDFSNYKVDMTFLPKVAQVMRLEAAASPCLIEPAAPTVILKSPRGDKALGTDADVEVLWASAHVEKVKLEYSVNNGTSWLPIGSDIAATDGRIIWRTPATPAQRALVRIVDMTRANVADTSIVPFKLVASVTGSAIAGNNVPVLTVKAVNGDIRVECTTNHRASRLAITLHDLNGREIGNIADVPDAAPGVRSAAFSTHGLASGVYIVTADADGSRTSSNVVIAR